MNSKTIQSFFFIVLILAISIKVSAQEVQNGNLSQSKSIKPLRLGVKVGIPNIITANAEYVTPLLGNRVALAIDYMSMSKTVDETEINYNNFEIGSNIYLNKKGSGLYGGISYFSFDGEGTFTETEFDDGSVADAIGIIKFNTVNLKLGAKVGRVFYFRLELGYGFGKIPEQIFVKSNTSSQTTYEDIPEIPGISNSGLPVFNFGIGFAFL